MARTVRLAASLAGAGLALWSMIAAAAAPAAWIQMTAAGAEARLVTSALACPSASLDGRPAPMRQRAGPAEGFPNRVCVLPLPPGVRAVVVDGLALGAPRRRPDRLVILGDSGCRLKGMTFQSCNDPSAWPFARVAALAAARRPDLIIHVGDYYYREIPCPRWNHTCTGSPWGDRWATWKAELFDPAAPLLAAAPWVFARGNHEDCGRGAVGWFRLLDAAAAPRACPAQSDTFAVDLGGARLFVVDSAELDDFFPLPGPVGAFAARMRPALRDRPGAGDWVVTHRPVWNGARFGDLVGDGLVNGTERAAMRGLDLAPLDLILSGHVHNFSSLGFGEARPAQLVVGASGDILDLSDTPPAASGVARVDGLAADIFSIGRFGYFVFDRRGGDWDGRFYDSLDRVTAVCRLHRRQLTCRSPKV